MFNESPVLIVGIVWSAIVAIIAVLAYYHFKRRELQSQEIMAAIEKGIEVPFPPQKKRNRFTQGIFWALMGVALMGALAVSTRAWEAAIWGLIPIAFGLATLLAFYFGPKMKD